MKRFCLPLTLLTLCCAHRALAQVVEGPPDYLIMVNTSGAFEPYRQTVRNFVYDLLESGVQGRMEDGDTYTIWTFNNEVDTTTYPVLRWTDAMRTDLAMRGFEFLRIRSFEGVNSWREAQIALFSAIKGVPKITVLLISDGFQRIKGTPYDGRINEVYANFATKFRDEGRPFITTLVGRDGKVVGAAVNTVGEKLVDPTPASMKEKPAPVVQAADAETSDPEPESSGEPVPPAKTVQEAAVEEEPVAEPDVAETAAETEPVIEIAAVEPEDVATESVEIEPEEAADSPQIMDDAGSVEEILDETAKIEEPVVEPEVIEIASTEKVVEETKAVEAAPPIEPKPLVPAEPEEVSRPDSPVVEDVVATSSPTAIAESDDPVDTVPSPIPPPEQEPAAPSSGNLAMVYYGLAGVCALVAAGLLGFWLGRSKARRQSSFITRSIDHQ